MKSIFIETVFRKKPSLRKEHLAFNLRTAPWIPFILLFVSSSIGLYVTPFEVMASPLVFIIHESWATPDVDEAYKVKGLRGVYWRVYSRRVKHRSPFSHSLLFGSTLRFAVGYLPIWILTATALYENWINLDIGWTIAIWFFVCCLSDIAHMIIDRMNPIEIIATGKP